MLYILLISRISGDGRGVLRRKGDGLAHGKLDDDDISSDNVNALEAT